MATVINNPSNGESSNGIGTILGIVLLAIIAFLFLFYGLPMLRGQVPTGSQVNIPSKIDVNVQGK